jgi:RND family efflux transporter MFP subunit
MKNFAFVAGLDSFMAMSDSLLKHRILCGVAVLVGLVLSGCAPEKKGDESLWKTAEVVRRHLDASVEVAGDLEPFQQVDVKPEVSARVRKIWVKVGQSVEIGQPLVELDDTDLFSEKRSAETDIAGARVECEQAQRSFVRAERLFQKKLVSQEVYDEAVTARDLARNSLEKTERRLQIVMDRLAKTRIVAPMAGVVLLIPVVEGQVVVAAASVNSGTTLLRLADVGRMQITTHINQVDVAQIYVGQKVGFGVDALPGVAMAGEVGAVAPIATVKNNVKGFEVKVWLGAVDPRVRPGMTANVSIPTKRAENVLAVPIHAVFTDGAGKKIVYVLKGEVPESREIAVGMSTLDAVEVLSGLEEGERILLRRPEGETRGRSGQEERGPRGKGGS